MFDSAKNWVANLLVTTLLLLGAAGCNSESAARTHLERGENYLNHRQFTEAALEFRSALEIRPNSSAAHFGLARAFEGQERIGETIEELRRAAAADRADIETRVKLVNYLLVLQPPNLTEADRLINEIFAVDANSVEGFVLKATLQAVTGRAETEVLATFDKAIALEPQHVETYLSKAEFFASRDDQDDAEKTFRQALNVNEQSAAAHLRYARFLAFGNRLDDAEQQLRRAVEVEPQNRDALEASAKFYLARQQFDRAEQMYQAIVDLSPDRPEERMVLADFYQSIKRNQDAARVCQEILEKKPEFSKARARLGEIALQQNDLAAANEQANLILQRNERDAEGLLLRARVRVRNNDYETAVKDLQEILKPDPKHKLALYFMADTLLKAGKIEPARNFINDLKRFHPEYLYSRQLDCNASLAADEPEKAIRQANDLLQMLAKAKNTNSISSGDFSDLKLGALTARGLANFQLDKLTEARVDFEQARDAAPNSANVYLNLAKIARRLKNNGDAVQLYQKTLELDGNNFDAVSGLTALFINSRQFAEAHRLVEQKLSAARLASDKAALLRLQANIFTAENQFDAAETKLKDAIATDADYLPAYLSYAALLSSRNQIDRAIEQYKQALAKTQSTQNVNAASIYTLIGLLEDSRNDRDAAVQNYNQALRLNQNQAIAANNLAWNYAAYNKGNLDEAATMAQKLVEKYPNEAGYADTLGLVYQRKGVPEVAAAQFRRAITLDQRAAQANGRAANSAYRMRLGTALAALGDKTAARREVEIALQNPRQLTDGELEQARKLLARLN